jgi:hypothetical protein
VASSPFCLEINGSSENNIPLVIQSVMYVVILEIKGIIFSPLCHENPLHHRTFLKLHETQAAE